MLGAAIKKDVWLLLRDRGSLIRLFVVPILFISLFGSMFKFGGRVEHGQPIAISYAEGDARGIKLNEAFVHGDLFAPIRVKTDVDARKAVIDDKAVAGVIVPASGPIEVAMDLEQGPQERGPTQGALTGIVERVVNGPPPAPAVVVTSAGPRAPADDISGFQVTVPANSVLFGFFIVITVALSFAGERRTGTWRRVLAAPVPRWQALVGTLVPYYLIGVFQLAVLFGIGAVGFGMTVAGSIPALVVLSMSVVLCAVCLGLVFASIGGTERQIGGVGSMTLLIMALLGGCMFPRMLMPAALQSIGHIVPHSWALDGYHTLLVKHGSGFADVAPSIAALLAFATAFAMFGLWRFRFEK